MGQLLIESGSLTPGIDPAAWRVPAGTALRYEVPDPVLRPLLPSYAVIEADPAIWTGPDDWLLPGWAQLWIVLTQGPVAVSMRRRSVPLGAAMVFGGTSQAMPVVSHGGVTVVVDISPMGWARLFDTSAEAARDSITPLDQLGHASWAEDLSALLHASDRAGEVKGLLDAFFLSRLPPPHRDEAAIARLAAALNGDTTADGGALADGLGLTPRAVRQLALQHFGHGPKVLMRRTRFLRALTAMLMADEAPDFAIAPPGYHDVPHFLRDAKLFLGLTPRRFLAIGMPYQRAALRARTMVLGAPLPLLDRTAATWGGDGCGAPVATSTKTVRAGTG
ncbi:helix-turn-helix domain-containing protein [uncultured Sphingomonas sp.]|uniref:AraC family transcriptional regulator n=1 Tax=uncultured Sphingomonas sp. TaxID=158754 RepID=UPI0035CBF611